MTIGTIFTGSRHIALSSRERKIPWDEPAFSQRMLENHLSQEHDWASRRREVSVRGRKMPKTIAFHTHAHLSCAAAGKSAQRGY